MLLISANLPDLSRYPSLLFLLELPKLFFSFFPGIPEANGSVENEMVGS